MRFLAYQGRQKDEGQEGCPGTFYCQTRKEEEKGKKSSAREETQKLRHW